MSAQRPMPIPETLREKLMMLAEETGQGWIQIGNEILARGVVERLSGRTLAGLDVRLKAMAAVVEGLCNLGAVDIEFTRGGFVVHAGEDTNLARAIGDHVIASKIKTEIEKGS